MSRPPPRETPLAAGLAERLRLVVVTDPVMAGDRGVLETVRCALEAGCGAIQLRDKERPAAELRRIASSIRGLTEEFGALLFVNDRVDLALDVGADGVHLGPTDLPVAAARAWAGSGILLGYSTDDPAEARKAVAAGADYLGCGAVFGTVTKDVGGEAIGPRGLDAVAASVEVPVIGIGGVTPSNVERVAATRAAGVAVVGSVMAAPDPGAAVRSLLAPFRRRGG